jgi:hypothetical protein
MSVPVLFEADYPLYSIHVRGNQAIVCGGGGVSKTGVPNGLVSFVVVGARAWRVETEASTWHPHDSHRYVRIPHGCGFVADAPEKDVYELSEDDTTATCVGSYRDLSGAAMTMAVRKVGRILSKRSIQC